MTSSRVLAVRSGPGHSNPYPEASSKTKTDFKRDVIPLQFRNQKRCEVFELLLERSKIMTSSRKLATCSGTDQNNSSPDASYSCPSLGQPRRHPTPTPAPAPALAPALPPALARDSKIDCHKGNGTEWGIWAACLSAKDFGVISPSSYNFFLEMRTCRLCEFISPYKQHLLEILYKQIK